MAGKKKKVFIGETFNRAEVTEEDRDAHADHCQAAKRLMTQAGELHKPLGCDYLGSATIHYFESQGLNHDYSVVCQTNVGNVVEQHADLGWKMLRDAFRKAYARPEPKTRNN